MSKARVSLNLLVVEEAKANLLREIARRRKAGDRLASQNNVVEELLLALGTPQASQAKR